MPWSVFLVCILTIPCYLLGVAFLISETITASSWVSLTIWERVLLALIIGFWPVFFVIVLIYEFGKWGASVAFRKLNKLITKKDTKNENR